jgi:GrpB-like predicted nucleotidyltransferase (UPF0157 family)
MLAHRRTWLIKGGCMDEALEMIQRAVDIFKEHGHVGRAYSSHRGPTDVIVWEEDWANEEEHERFWVQLRADPEVTEWFERWHTLVERGGSQEVWHLRA